MSDYNDAMSEAEELQALHEARIAQCPIKPCRSTPQDEMRLRDIRTDRPLCHYCAVPTPVGYIAREVAKAHEDRFYTATLRDYIVAFLIVMGATLIANLLVRFIPFLGFFIFALFVGLAAGTTGGTFARRATGKRVGRRSTVLAAGAAVIGGLVSPIVFIFLRFGVLLLDPQVIFASLADISLLICTGAAAVSAYGAFSRRI